MIVIELALAENLSDSYRIEIVVVRLGLDLRTGQWGDTQKMHQH